MQADNNSRVAMVTGASRGIGRAVALTLAQRGWRLCITYLSNEAAARATADEIRKLGSQALVVQADIASQADCERVFASSHENFGRLDALVNNAGVVGGQRSIFDADATHLRGVFEANVLGLFYCASLAARTMSTQKGGQGGAIVNLSSVASRTGGMLLETHYAASKGAVDSFTMALARELAPHGIRVNAVRPGLIDTDIHEAHGGQETLKKLGPTVPMGRVGQAQEVADVVAFLCDQQSSYIDGTLVDVSGGR